MKFKDKHSPDLISSLCLQLSPSHIGRCSINACFYLQRVCTLVPYSFFPEDIVIQHQTIFSSPEMESYTTFHETSETFSPCPPLPGQGTWHHARKATCSTEKTWLWRCRMMSGSSDHEERVEYRNKGGLTKRRMEEEHGKEEGKRLVGCRRRNKYYL